MEHKITIFVDEGPPIAHKVKKKNRLRSAGSSVFLIEPEMNPLKITFEV
jgi:hypothetical protein